MLLKIVELAPSEKQDFSLQMDVKQLGLTTADGDFGDVVTVCGSILYTGTLYRVSGKLNYERSYVCDRCQKECHATEELDFSEDFSRENSDADMATPLTGDTVDMGEMVRDLLITNVPIQNLCRADCLGLCPVCGHDLNESDCGCDREIIDPRWADLLDAKCE